MAVAAGLLGVDTSVGLALLGSAGVYTAVGALVLQPRLLGGGDGGGEREQDDPAARFLQRALSMDDVEQVAAEFRTAVQQQVAASSGFLVAPSRDGSVRCVGGGPGIDLQGADEAFAWLGERTEPVTRHELGALSEFPGARATLQLMQQLGADVVLPLRHRGVLMGLGAIVGPRAMPSQAPAFYKAMRAYATVALANTFLGAETRSGSQLARTLDLATAMQESLMPDERVVRRPSFELRGVFEPVAECGGDLWAWRELGRKRLLIVIADATGHGAAPALLAAVAKGALDAQWQLHGADVDPARLLEALNLAIHHVGRTRYLMTAFAAVLDAEANELRFANAAQNFPFFLSRGGVEALVARGNTLGAAAEVRYETHRRPMYAGDKLVLYTDGIVDVASQATGPFGEKRLRNAVVAMANERATRIPDLILDEVKRYGAGQEVIDDITIAAVEMGPFEEGRT